MVEEDLGLEEKRASLRHMRCWPLRKPRLDAKPRNGRRLNVIGTSHGFRRVRV
jgi:hypothetical protein